MKDNHHFQVAASLFFALALLHTFLAGAIMKWGNRFREGSFLENLFHLFGEVEIVFGFWSALLVLWAMIFIDFAFINDYLNSRNFTEALFVFVIMAICSTKPIIVSAEKLLLLISRLIPLKPSLALFFVILFFAPLLGSFITEPAAMTIAAFLLLPRFFGQEQSLRFKYATMALLFINVSIGGTLTPYAAPPVLMVAAKWGWDLQFMLTHFAPHTLIAVFLNTVLVMVIFRRDIEHSKMAREGDKKSSVPLAISLIHGIFLVLVVLVAHYPVMFIGLFLFFLGFIKATHEYQGRLSLREPLLVGFFLAGLIVLGGPQAWWLTPLISSMGKLELFVGSIGLTAITDNAALTYLGSLVPSLDFESKLALVKGSVVGGGLTLIANAPNPAGFGILRSAFAKEPFSAFKLFFWALPLTILTALVFIF